MTVSLYDDDARTYLKIVVVCLIMALVVMAVAIAAHANPTIGAHALDDAFSQFQGSQR